MLLVVDGADGIVVGVSLAVVIVQECEFCNLWSLCWTCNHPTDANSDASVHACLLAPLVRREKNLAQN